MFRNNIVFAWRNLNKNKVFSFINIFGLTTGITVCLMIFLFIMHEFSFDRFHARGENIYRVVRGFDPATPPAPFLSGPYAPALANDFRGEIREYVRVMVFNNLISYNSRHFNEKKVFVVDSNFFTFFTFPLLRGNPATVLKDPNSVVITETTAKKYFGDQDPIGKVLDMDKDRHLRVTGIARDAPSNSHLDFDLITPISYYTGLPFMNNWLNNNNYTYVLLDPKFDPAAIEQRFPAFMDKYMGKIMARTGYRFALYLHPLREVYFEDASSFDRVKHGDKKVVYIFLSIAALILIIACINFMNLSTIRATERGKEVGLRKVMGALRYSLAFLFLGESLLMALISCVFSFFLLYISMPEYEDLLGYRFMNPYRQWYLYAFLVAVVLVVGMLAGGYPALVLSRFSPIDSLKGRLRRGKSGLLFRHALVVVQFGISVFLITGTLIVGKQMRYIKNKELGYNQEQTLIVQLDNHDIYNHLKTFKQDLQHDSHIASVSMMSGEPGGYFDEHTFEAEGRGGKAWLARTEFSDFDLVRTLGLRIIAGRDLSPQYPTDSTQAVLINRKAAEELGYGPEQAIGKWIRNSAHDSLRRRVVGVVDNFNYASLKNDIGPLVISPSEDLRVAVVRLKTGDLQSGIGAVGKAYANAATTYPFEYTFLDQKFDELYRKDIRQEHILTIFSGLAIVIACLGLFGLASFTAAKRTKEIGVRKVLGSSVPNILLLLSRELLKPVMLATLIAIPVAWLVMDHWLDNFAYRTTMDWWVFVLSGLITVVIAVATVSLKALRVALANPTESLRSD